VALFIFLKASALTKRYTFAPSFCYFPVLVSSITLNWDINTAIPAISLKTGAHRPVAALIFAQAQAPLKP
jgi:hypothetical protein